jgi:hypothetical protein
MGRRPPRWQAATAFTSAINIHGGNASFVQRKVLTPNDFTDLEAAHQRRMTHARTSIRQYVALPNGKVRPESGRPGAQCNRQLLAHQVHQPV